MPSLQAISGVGSTKQQLVAINNNFQKIQTQIGINSFTINKKGIQTSSLTVLSGATNTVTIAHGLGYVPAFQVFVSLPGATGVYSNVPSLSINGSGVITLAVTARADNTSLYLDVTNPTGSTYGPATFVFKYYIFQETAG